jgi:L-rhamnonate dehydratase
VSDLRITDVRVRSLAPRPSTEVRAPDVPWLCTPTTQFPDVAERNYWGPVNMVLVEIDTNVGITGVGTCGAGNAGIAPIIAHQFRELVMGEDPFRTEYLWAKMYRSSSRYGRRGAPVSAISGVDIALYDIIGKSLGVPVYDLLGGLVRTEATAYASRLYALKDLDELAAEARGYLAQGYRMMKQRFGFGPKDGVAGMRRNVDLIRTVRETIGDDVELAADAYMGWDLDYAVRMERMLRPYNLKWIEEPLMPHDMRGYVELRRGSETPISHGEHYYTRWEFAEAIALGAADILQPDVNRLGGITEARKVFALGAARDIPMIPHSNELHNLHFVFSQWNCPFAEYFPNVLPEDSNSMFWQLFSGNPVLDDGTIAAPTAPGLGYTLDEDVADQMTVRL